MVQNGGTGTQSYEGLPRRCKLLRQGSTGGFGPQQKFKFEQVWGVEWTPEEFVATSRLVRHPFEAVTVDDGLAATIFSILKDGPRATMSLRASELARWSARAKVLEPEETKLHDTFHPSHKLVMRGKKLLLLKEMLLECAHPDVHLVDDLISGASLTGQNPNSNFFPKVPRKEGVTTTKSLRDQAKWVQANVKARCKPSDSPEMDLRVWLETKEEVEAGWLSAPMSSTDQVTAAIVFSGWVPSLRLESFRLTKLG